MAIEKNTLARPYAKAAFEFALDANDLDAWAAFLETAAAVSMDSQVKECLIDPRVSKEQALDLFTTVCKKGLNENRQNFLAQLAENNRLDVLPEVSQLFALFKADHEKSIEVDVKTFKELSNEQEEKLSAALKKRLERSVNLNITIDESLLGGTIIRAGDLVIDGSIKTKLARLQDELVA